MASNVKVTFDFDRKLSTFSVGTWLKFILFSLFGVFSFFINIRLPEYKIVIGSWEWGTVAAQSNVLCSHLTNFVKAAFYTGNFNFMPFVVWAIGLFAVIDVIWLRPQKAWKDKITSAFSIFKIIGFVVLCINIIDIYFHVHPGFMNWMFDPVASLNNNSIANFVMANILVTICISIPAASLFLPFLVDYGLVDFIGVFVRLIMRPVFKLPGRAAIIMVTAFLGNFSAGHIAVNKQLLQDRPLYRAGVRLHRHQPFHGLRRLPDGAGNHHGHQQRRALGRKELLEHLFLDGVSDHHAGCADRHPHPPAAADPR